MLALVLVPAMFEAGVTFNLKLHVFIQLGLLIEVPRGQVWGISSL